MTSTFKAKNYMKWLSFQKRVSFFDKKNELLVSESFEFIEHCLDYPIFETIHIGVNTVRR